LAEAGRRNVRDYNLIIEVIKTKNGRYKDAINALCYTTYKARWDYFNIIFDAKYREIHLSVPRGFTDEAQFRAFSKVFSAEYFKYQTGGNRREMPANKVK
jgi:hypothetical protein